MAIDQRDRAGVIAEFERAFSAKAIRQRRWRRFIAICWVLAIRLLNGCKRAFDFLLASALLLVLSPLLLFLYWRKGVVRISRMGRWSCTFHQYRFPGGLFQALPSLVNVWKGDMSFVGPRAAAVKEVSPADRLAWRRFSVRPGLVCLWWLRARANIAYGVEGAADAEYIDTHSFWGDLGIALRAIPASLYGDGVALAPERIELLGIPIDNLTLDETLEVILQKAASPTPSQVCFVNADCINIAFHDREYKDLLGKCGLVLADGIGVKLAGRILNRNIRQNVNGTDLLPALCAALEKSALGLYLLGGKPGVAEEMARRLTARYPGLPLRGWSHGYFPPAEAGDVMARIRQSGARILLVALGAPKQDKWLRDHLSATGASVGIGVGGLFDFYSGRVRRAPVWVREICMEWFYRFLQEPRRMWRRYFVGNAVFLVRVIRDRLREPSRI